MLSRLRDVGCVVDDTWQEMDVTPRVVDVLSEWLRETDDGTFDLWRFGAANRLVLPPKVARAHWSRLIEVHTAERDEFAKAPVGEAVTRDTLPALIELLADHTLGESRIMLVRALKRLRGPERDAALAQLREDSTFHAALGVRSKRSGERRTVVPRRGRPVHRTQRPARASRSCARTPSRPYLRYWVSAKSPG